MDKNWKEIISENDFPPLHIYVLVFQKNMGTDEPQPISIARIDNEKKWEFLGQDPDNGIYGAYTDLEWEMDGDLITHWMPLPKEPETFNKWTQMNDEIILPMMKEPVLEAEFGSSCPVRFWNPKLYDNDGNEILCECGKSAEQIIAGKNSYIVMCDSCRRKKEEMNEYPPCKKCGKSHGMGIENMETGEITPINICSDCLWAGYSPRKVEQPIYLDMQDDEIENKIDEMIQKVKQHMELCKND